MSNLTVVVAGVPALATALEGSGQFSRVVGIASTSELKALLQSRTLSSGVGDKVFMFADSTVVDTPQNLPLLISKLTAMRAPVIIVATSPGARDLVDACPGAGLLEGPLKLNQALGAISGMPGVAGSLSPVANNVSIALPGFDEPAAHAAPAAPAAPAFPTQAAPAFGQPAASPFPAPAPAAQVPAAQVPATPAPGFPAAPAFPAATPFPPAERPAGQQAPAPRATLPAAPAAEAPAFGGPAAPAFGQPSAQAPSFEAPATPAPSQTPPARRSLTQPPAFGQPVEQAPASPFGTAPAAPATPAFGGPASPQAPVSPFGTAPAQAPGVPASPFGQPASPFGSPATVATPGPVSVMERPTSPWGQAAPAARVGAPQMMTEAPARLGRVVTVAAPKGGTGKSTMSLNLAAYLGLRLRGTGRNVCLIDANVQQADTGKYLNAYTPNVEYVLKDPAAIHPDRINSYLLHKPDLNMSALLGPATPENANPLYFTGRRYSQILDALRPNYDYIFIDTPVAELYHDLFREFALPQADYIIVTITPNTTTLLNTDTWLRQVTASRNADGMGIDPAKVGIVLNRAQDDIGLSEDEARRELGEWNWLGSIPETKEWQRCNNENEVVATKNFHELNEAFSIVLSHATGEELLSTTPPHLAPQRGAGQLGQLLSRFMKKKG